MGAERTGIDVNDRSGEQISDSATNLEWRVVVARLLCDHDHVEVHVDFRGVAVPLSEDEQRILTEIELQLRASDPGLVREVGETTVYSAPLRRTRFAILGLILGMVVTVVLLFQVNAYAAFVVGFGLMFASAFALERNIRHLGRVGLGQLASTVRSSGVRDLFGLASDEDSDRSENDEA